MRRVKGLARSVGVVAAASLGLVLTSCASPNYSYIGSSDHDLVLRVPRNWSAVNTKDALKATGVDPATVTGWRVYYDAYDHPDPKHLQLTSPSEPILVAQTLEVAQEQRASVTNDQLRQLLLPADATALQAATASGTFALLKDETESRPKQHGVHLLFTIKAGTTTEYYDQIALTNPKQTVVSLVYVHCNQQCFQAHKSEIDDAVTSLTLKTH